jgi:ascorbate-specific PTS system EIIC-type component UlaA
MDLKWAYLTFGVGILIVLIEYVMASKKKGGVTATDKKSMIGLFWLSIGAAGLVAFLTNA